MTVPVDVHWADPASARANLSVLLDEHELTRHSRFVRAEDRDRYLVGHALTRRVLAASLGTDPAMLEFDRTCSRCGEQHGKPTLIGSDVHFSLSHSGSKVVVAVCTGYAIGVDVEAVGAARGLATELLDAWELDRLPDHDTDRALTVWWARKEAVLKSTGDGLSVAPTAIRVSTPSDPPQLLRWQGNPRIRVTLADLDPGPGYSAAVAVVGDRPLAVTEHDATDLLAAR